jgi:hypothetical protein
MIAGVHNLSRGDVNRQEDGVREARFSCTLKGCGWRKRYTDFALGTDWSRAQADHDKEMNR